MTAMRRATSAGRGGGDVPEAMPLYEQFGKPLESSHWGEFLAISRDGQTVLGNDLIGVAKQATDRFGPGNVIFRIGDVVVGTWL